MDSRVIIGLAIIGVIVLIILNRKPSGSKPLPPMQMTQLEPTRFPTLQALPRCDDDECTFRMSIDPSTFIKLVPTSGGSIAGQSEYLLDGTKSTGFVQFTTDRSNMWNISQV